jgi:PelA/Pel-15E family pectate lyase
MSLARFAIMLCLALVAGSGEAHAGAASAGGQGTAAGAARPVATSINWKDSLKQPPAWYGGEEAVRIADNVLLYQHEDGGWPKNIDMAARLSERERTEVLKAKSKEHSTIDNGATYTQLAYLARVYTASRQERHRDAFLRGLDYLLEAQYDNGGWPQYYPLRKGYYSHITYNDGAMLGVMKLLRDVAAKKADYAFVDEARRTRAARAVQKGIECILKTQVVAGGRRTAWGAQHDEVTLAPAAARKYEPPSLSSPDSATIVRFLMGIRNPSPREIEAIQAAVAWFEKSKINGLKWVERPDPSKPGGYTRMAIKDPGAGPIWARFYEIGTDRPIFLGRDSVVHYDVSEIEEERRNGYQWYVSTPAEVLEEYPAWLERQRAARPAASN